MFCPNCGNNVPDESGVCPNCGSTLRAQTPATAPTQAPVESAPVASGSGDFNVLALVCGIVSIVLGSIGAILFGVIPAIIGIITGVIAVIFGIMTKKNTNGVKGTAAFICGIIGLACSVVFAVGCAACACSTEGYMAYGCVGGSCKAANDTRRAVNSLYYDLFDY